MKYFLVVLLLLLLAFLAFKIFSKPKILIQNTSQENTPQITVIAQNLDTPWAIVFLPNGEMLVTERSGKVDLIDKNNNLTQIATITSAKEIGEGGLLGITIHPDFSKNNYVYLYHTYQESNGNTLNRVVRMIYKNQTLTGEKVIVDNIPGASNHNGGRIKFGPDGFLYITTGDAQNSSKAQDTNSLSGKILRVTDEGQPAPGNPFKNLIFSFGHRNPQGLAWDKNGALFATEHGRSGALSGLDELNLIQIGKNYGWPDSQGDEVRSNTVGPIKHSGAATTWAPSGIAYYQNSLYFGGLRGQSLYEARIPASEGAVNGGQAEIIEHYKNQFGRIREVVLGPDDFLYITTSNRDGRGNPDSSDDKIIKIKLPL